MLLLLSKRSLRQIIYSYSNATYTELFSKIYNALLKAGRYEEAWGYHARSYDGEDYPGNAPDFLRIWLIV